MRSDRFCIWIEWGSRSPLSVAVSRVALCGRRYAVAVMRSVLFLGLCACVAGAQEHPIRFTARMAGSNVVQPGARAAVEVRASIPSGWHLYGLTEPAGGPIATTIAVGPASVATIAGAIRAPPPISAPDPNFGLTTSYYADSARFIVPVAIDALARGRQTPLVRVGYQTCNERY